MKTVLSNILKDLPKEDKTNYRPLNKTLFQNNDKVCIIIDDDPTGNQTVYGIPLLTTWTLDVLTSEFINRTPVFFLLTNSRSLSASETAKIYLEVAKNIAKVSKLTQRNYTIVSRSDSTLRGHFPLEPDTLKKEANLNEAITVFIPVMFEGGRVTVNDIHYVSDSEKLTPVSKTPFAQDHTFRYTKSNLKAYIEEKTNGKILTSDIYSFSINAIRTQNPKVLANQIIEIPPNRYCIFNSLNYSDLDKVTNALLLAEESGKKIIYRTSSSFVPSYIGLEPKGLIDLTNLLKKSTSHGGLTIVGSYVKKSSEQLIKALELFNPRAIIEVDVNEASGVNSKEYLKSLIRIIDTNIKTGRNTMVFTSRKLVTGINVSSTISMASIISQALVDIVNGLSAIPKYIIAKGGITSHDIATKGLGMKKSKVLGQVLPGIPLWKMGEETKFPKLPYIVFPGNVGDENSLYIIIQKLANHD